MSRLKFLILLFFCYFLALVIFNKVNAATIPLTLDGHIKVQGGVDYNYGTYKNKPLNAPAAFRTPAGQLAQIHYPNTPINVPTSQGTKSVAIKDIVLKADSSRIGKAAILLGKSIPFATTAYYAYELFCEDVGICVNPAQPTELQKKEASAPANPDYPPSTPNYSWDYGTLQPPNFPTPLAAAKAYVAEQTFLCSNQTCAVGALTEDYEDRKRYRLLINGENNGQFYIDRVTGCPTGYTYNGSLCITNASAATYRPLTQSDWDAAYAYYDQTQATLAATNVFAHFINQNNGDLPVEPPEFEPQVFYMPSDVTTIRDPQGIATGTKTKDTVLEVVRGSDPQTVVTTEKTTITDRDPNGQSTGSTTTVESNAPGQQAEQPKQEWPTIEIDNVPDVELPTYEVPADLSYSSWGEGSCPADPSFNSYVGAITIPLQPVCESMSLLRPATILIAFLVAGFIISGVKTND